MKRISSTHSRQRRKQDVKQQTSHSFTKEMSIQKILDRCPGSEEIMLSYGLHCIGCFVSTYETLEEGALAHGLSKQDMNHMLREINSIKNKYHDITKQGITITGAAVKFMLDTMHKWYCVEYIPSKDTHSFIIEPINKKDRDQTVLHFSDKISLLIPRQHRPLFRKLKIDYTDSRGLYCLPLSKAEREKSIK